MSAAGRSEDAPDRVAAALRDAEFVRLVATADGDALAATGLLARALDATEVPYQASLAAIPEPPATDADCTVAIGHNGASDVVLRETPLSVAAADVARTLAPDAVDPELALAGAVSAGAEPSGALLEAADLQRRPGVAIPTDDRIDGLAGSTLVHASFSGDGEAVEAALDGIDGDHALASFVALSAVQDAPPRAATAVERALSPYDCDRFETLGGFADVLDAVAEDRPGTGIALALGHGVETAALETWRAHGQRAHTALRSADTSRYNGLYVARTDGGEQSGGHPNAPLGTVARLLFTYRSPEPVALVVSDGQAAIVAEESVDAADALREAAAGLNGRATARDGRGRATFDGSATDYVAAFRGAV
ncbi:MAG: hypothetical protein ACI8UR_001619 [Natronomonas sp.]|jgi:hypothetical protein|uniref:hypothetical protein n=1 Tax=Natronomonas sp. TaxID=2184060 RepID=UPI003989F196